METFKKFALAVLRLAASLAFATLVVAGVIWGVIAYRDSAERRNNAPLAVKKTWRSIDVGALGKANVSLATIWRDGRIFYQFSVDGFPPAIAQARVNNSAAAFTLVFSDADGFKLFEKQIKLSEMVALANGNGEDSGLDWADDEFVSAENYRRAAQWELYWVGLTPPPKPPAVRLSLPPPAEPQRPPVPAAAPLWKNRMAWRRLAEGLNQDSVRSMLGEPTRIIRYGSAGTVWFYGDIGNSGTVDFTTAGLVSSWSEP